MKPNKIKNGRIECLENEITDNQYQEGSRCLYKCRKNYKLPRIDGKEHPGFIECRVENEKTNAVIWANELKEKFNSCLSEYELKISLYFSNVLFFTLYTIWMRTIFLFAIKIVIHIKY